MSGTQKDTGDADPAFEEFIFIGPDKQFIMFLQESNLLCIDLPIKVVDILYVSKKSSPIFGPQGKFCLVPDACEVIL